MEDKVIQQSFTFKNSDRMTAQAEECQRISNTGMVSRGADRNYQAAGQDKRSDIQDALQRRPR